MDIFSENLNDSPFGRTGDMVEDAINRLIQYGKKAIDTIRKDYIPLLDDMMKNISGEIKGIAYGKEVDVLDMETLVSVSKQYMVKGSNEIVALKVLEREKETGKDAFFVYLAYSKDRVLMPVSENRYIIIKSSSLAMDVEKLFAESQLVILK